MWKAIILATLLACSKRGSTTGGGDCSHVGDPTLAEAKKQETEGKDQLARKFAKMGPVMAATIVKNCQDNKWSAKTIEACSKELPLQSAMTACDASMTADQIAALRTALSAQPLTGSDVPLP